MNTYKNSIPKILSRYGVTKFFLFIAIATASLVITSCNESSVVGLNVQPTHDLLNVGFQDTTTVVTRTIREDSLRSDGILIANGVGLIGKYIDPVFGEATGSVYTQVRLPSDILSNSFGIHPVCDSIILSLVYESTVYGKQQRVAQKMNVYQILQDMNSSSAYYSDTTLLRNSTDLTAAASSGGFSFVPRPLDSVTVLGIRLRPQLRVPLDKTLGNLLLNNQTTGNLVDNTAFQTFFKGIYITTEHSVLSTGDGNITHFYMGESLLTLYYHNDENDSLHYDFSLGSLARFNHYTHNYAAADPGILTQIGPSPPAQNSTLYIQSMSGLKTKVTFPYLMNWANPAAIAINKAELVIKIDNTNPTYTLLDTFAAPAALLVYGINDDGSPYLIPDEFEGSTYFDGTYNTTTLEYHFNIARYVQQILEGKRANTGLYLLASNGVIYGNRVVVGGGAPGPNQMKLNITYTKLH